MTITISINIQLDPDDLAAFGYHAAAAWAALLTPPTTTAPAAPVPAPTRKSSVKSAKTAHIDVKPQNGPETHGTPVLVPDVPASDVAPEIAAILPATDEAEPTEPAIVGLIIPASAIAAEPEAPKPRNTRPREPLPFAEFDKLVRKEIRRLGMDKRIPNAKLWDAERDERLPTYAAVMYRYGCTNLGEFAEKMGMQPPLSPRRFPLHREADHAATA